MKDNFSAVAQGYKHAGQSPLDAKNLIEDLIELDYTSNGNLAFTFYEGYMPFVYEKKEHYIWTDLLEGVSDSDKLFEDDFTYPNGSIYSEIDYSQRVFNFVSVKFLLGGNSAAAGMIIGQLLGKFNLDISKGFDVQFDEEISPEDLTLLNYLQFFYKRNNLLNFVDNLFAFTTSDDVAKELDDIYASNSMFNVFGNKVTVDDVNDPTQITFKSKRNQGTETQINLDSHNGIMHLIAMKIYNVIQSDSVGYIDLQSHDGHFISFKFKGSDVLFAKGEPFSALVKGSFNFANFIQITGTLDAKYGTLSNKAVKVSVRSIFGVNDQLTLPNTNIPIKKSVVDFTRKEVEDNGFVMQHGLNVERYISEHFSYPTSIYDGKVPMTLSPRELIESRIVSNYGPNDANTIYLGDIVPYRNEDESEKIYYIVEYIEKMEYELVMPYNLTQIIPLNNDPEETIDDFSISREGLGAGFSSPYDGSGDHHIGKLRILEIETTDSEYPDEILKFDGDPITLPFEFVFGNLTDEFTISVQASGGNRSVKKFIYEVEDHFGRLSNPVQFEIIKQSKLDTNNRPPIINPSPITNGDGDILASWGSVVRLTSLGMYYLSAVPYDPDSEYTTVESPGELEVNFKIIRESDSMVVFNETHPGIRSEQMISTGFNFPNLGSGGINTVNTFFFRFTVTDPQGATSTTERKLIIIY